jgi:hypothetical protein
MQRWQLGQEARASVYTGWGPEQNPACVLRLLGVAWATALIASSSSQIVNGSQCPASPAPRGWAIGKIMHEKGACPRGST